MQSRWRICGLIAVVAVTSAGAIRPRPTQPRAQIKPCVPATNTPEQQARRRQLVQLARQINTAESQAISSTRTPLPLEGIAPTLNFPKGTAFQLAVKDESYIFTIKDTLDPCQSALFSDESGLIYAGEPFR
jgi:hypothetical protein